VSSYSPNAWNQLKNISPEASVKALLKDDWVHEETSGAIQAYRKPDGTRVTIHYHPGKTYGAGLLKDLLKDIGWSESDMKKLKLIK